MALDTSKHHTGQVAFAGGNGCSDVILLMIINVKLPNICAPLLIVILSRLIRSILHVIVKAL